MNTYLNTLFNVEGKVVLLTGAGGHLVGEMSRSLAKAGMKIVCCDSKLEAAQKTVTEITEAGGEAIAVQLDVRNTVEHEQALAAALQKFGRLDCVLNGAGANAPTPFLDISVEEWNDIIAVQLTGTMLSCQVYGKHMLAQGAGSIINISSASAGPPLSKAFTYSVAKAGVKNLTQNIAREWGTSGVRVNALRPGFFPTEWSMKHFITAEREAAILGHTAMKRYGKPSELIGAVLWLFSDAAAFVTGAEIAVDGGFSAMTI
ncbi:MAG: SDR family oxidoreductase [Chitinophagaceae bacterium]|nr:SDR family oxidoreductase [Chitinophagaceae bacterium]